MESSGNIFKNTHDQKRSFHVLTNEIAKNIGSLFKTTPFLNKQSLLSLYYSYIHNYINYANVAWASAFMTDLKKLSNQKKHAMRII